MSAILPPTPTFAWPTLNVDPKKLLALLKSMTDLNYQYQLGGKVVPITAQAADVAPEHRAIDCSGFTRWTLWHALQATGFHPSPDIPDGSVNQHEWCINRGFKFSDAQACELSDGAVRWFFLNPQDGGGIGHTGFAYMGRTLESHGHHGPDYRPFNGQGWEGRVHAFVIVPPVG